MSRMLKQCFQWKINTSYQDLMGCNQSNTCGKVIVQKGNTTRLQLKRRVWYDSCNDLVLMGNWISSPLKDAWLQRSFPIFLLYSLTSLVFLLPPPPALGLLEAQSLVKADLQTKTNTKQVPFFCPHSSAGKTI